MLPAATAAGADRTAFLDNLRTIMVLLVLVFHSGASYGSAVEFWPFHDKNPSKVIDLVMFLLDMFMMSVLFFVAGYFALPSLRKKGLWPFVWGKVRRLGLPWVVVIVLLLPVLDYVHYWHNAANDGLPARGYAQHWVLSMRRIADFHVGWMNMTSYSDMTQHFYQRYMWYISLLILFFVLFAVAHSAGRRLCRGAGTSVQGSLAGRSPFLPLALTGVVTILLFALLKFLVYSDFLDKGWFSLGNLFQFQCGKLVIYGCYFALGVFAYAMKWFTRADSLGRPWKWGIACLVLFCVNMYVLMTLSKGRGDLSGLRLAFVTFYPLWTLSFLGLFLSFAAARLNRSGPISRSLADHSYNMYLAHYVIPMTMPMILARATGMATSVKFGLVFLATLALSYAASRYLIKPFPRSVVIGLVCLSIMLFAVT